MTTLKDSAAPIAKDPAVPPAAASDQDALTLAVLDSIHRDSNVTQRSLARELGIALGLANGYLKRCLNKGYIKVAQAPRNRYAYYLTPSGFTEKSRLVGAYLYQSFNLFRAARVQYNELAETCRANGWTRIAMAGGGDLAEIALLSLRGQGLHLVCLFNRDDAGGVFAEVPISASPADFPVDAVLLTDLQDHQATLTWLREHFTPERILAPRMLLLADPPAQDPADHG